MIIFICDKDVSSDLEIECCNQIYLSINLQKKSFSFISSSLRKSVRLFQDHSEDTHEWWIIDIEPRGSNCSISGKNYELQIYNTLKNVYWNGEHLNTQTPEDLGGSSSKNDIICNYNREKIVGIEVKKLLSPDWGQCSLKFDEQLGKWTATKEIFNQVLSHITIFNNKIPPFVTQNLTHQEWISFKKQTSDFNDVYIDIPSDTIKNVYTEKGCYYIQVSEKGLYHLGNDIYEFGVPEFEVEQQLRVRTKIHSRANAKGYCQLSVVAACIPKNIKNMIPSPYSLDKPESLPQNLKIL